MTPGPFPVLLYATSALWLLAGACAPYHCSGDASFLGFATLLPALGGALLSRYPWMKKPAPAEVPRDRKAALIALMIVGGLWIAYSTVVLSLFFLITATTGWD